MKLQITEGPDAGTALNFDDHQEITVGRSEDCEVHLNDVEASRRHARIWFENGRVLVRDLNSKNGTLLNDTLMSEGRLRDGDEILVGASLLRVTGIPVPPADTSTKLTLSDAAPSVVVSVHHREADILSGASHSGTADEMAREIRLLREVSKISQIIASNSDTQAVLATILDDVRELLEADTACVVMHEGEGEGEWSVRAAARAAGATEAVNVSRTIARKALEEGNAILSADTASDQRFDASQSIIMQGIASALCSPLRIRDRFRGVLFLDRRQRRKAFTPLDLRLAATVGNIVGLLLEREQYEMESRSKARLALIGEVMAGLAHDIKNIMTGFRFGIESLERAFKRQRYDYVEKNLRSLATQEFRISDLMLNMLSYAKDREPIRSRVRIQDLVDHVVEPQAPRMEEEGVKFECCCPPDLPCVHGEEIALYRLFLNLVLNAMGALESRKDGEPKLIRISAQPCPEDNAVDIRFYDTGCGIPAEKLSKIFGAFYSTKGASGTGLGLAVAEKIVCEHGGKISVDSKESEWTEFRIVLPAAS